MSENRADADAVSNPNAERVNEDRAVRRARLDLLGLLLGAAVGLGLLSTGFREQQVAFEDLALGPDTSTYFAKVGGDPIHCLDLDDADDCLRGYARRGGRPAVVWLGNSQLHAVNQYEKGQETATAIVHRELEGEGLDLLAFSQPNANLQEHLVLYAWLAQRVQLRALVLPMVFDDARETGLRTSVARALDDPAVVERLEPSEIGRKIIATQRSDSENSDLAALEGTFQETTEAALIGWLDAHWRLWAQRPQLRGTLMQSLFLLRNTLFGITSTTTRRTIPGRLALNLEAAEALLLDAREHDIATAVYVAPLRGDVPPPYVAAQYARFRSDVAALARRSGARFGDLDALVPAQAWGTTSGPLAREGEIDFMHFRAVGHRLLARAVERLVQAAVGDAS